MNEAFSQYLDEFIIVYLDGILIYSDTWEDHLDHIRKSPESTTKREAVRETVEVLLWRSRS